MFKSYIIIKNARQGIQIRMIEYMNYDVYHTNECGKNTRFIYQFQSLKFNARLT